MLNTVIHILKKDDYWTSLTCQCYFNTLITLVFYKQNCYLLLRMKSNKFFKEVCTTMKILLNEMFYMLHTRVRG